MGRLGCTVFELLSCFNNFSSRKKGNQKRCPIAASSNSLMMKKRISMDGVLPKLMTKVMSQYKFYKKKIIK